MKCPRCGFVFHFDPRTLIARLRAERGLTQPMVSMQTGISLDEIRRMERGGSNPRLSSMRKLSKFYGMSIEDLFPETDDENEEFDPADRPQTSLQDEEQEDS